MKIGAAGLPGTARVQSTGLSFYKTKTEGETKGKGTVCFDNYQSSRALFFDENGIPKNFLMGGEKLPHGSVNEMEKQIHSAYLKYYKGEIDETAVQDVLSDVVEQLRSNYVELGYKEAEIMPHIIEDVYASARLTAVSSVDEASWFESRALAAAYNGHDGNTRDWIYYDSKYYYSCEKVKLALLEHAKNLGAQYGVSDLNLPADYRAGDPRSIYSSYNSVVNDTARNEAIIGNMLDDSMIPPRDFRFFYKGGDDGHNIYPGSLPGKEGDPDSIFDGILQIWHGDWSFTGRVPTRFDATRYPVSLNMFDVVSRNSAAGVPDDIVPFLKNMDFFTTLQSGAYFKSHPRRH